MIRDITLTFEQLALCRHYAQQRGEPKRAMNVKNRKIGKQSDFDLDYLGLRGEMAFAEIVGLPLHQITESLLQGDGGHEDYRLLGLSVSLKTRPANRRFFLMPQYLYPPTADLIVMMEEVNESTMRFVGWCTGANFIERHEQINLGYGLTRAIRDQNLRSYDAFLIYLNDIMDAQDAAEASLPVPMTAMSV